MKLSDNAKLVLEAVKKLQAQGDDVVCASVWNRECKNQMTIGSVGAHLNSLKKKGLIEVVGTKSGWGNKYKVTEAA